MWTKEQTKEYKKSWDAAHKESEKEKMKEYRKLHKDKLNEYRNTDMNSFGDTKHNIRAKSQYYLNKYGKKIKGYHIHHCCTYDEPYKFIYCNKKIHLLIHAYLRQHNINADSDHYQYIKHLLDDTVIKYNVD